MVQLPARGCRRKLNLRPNQRDGSIEAVFSCLSARPLTNSHPSQHWIQCRSRPWMSSRKPGQPLVPSCHSLLAPLPCPFQIASFQPLYLSCCYGKSCFSSSLVPSWGISKKAEQTPPKSGRIHQTNLGTNPYRIPWTWKIRMVLESQGSR